MGSSGPESEPDSVFTGEHKSDFYAQFIQIIIIFLKKSHFDEFDSVDFKQRIDESMQEKTETLNKKKKIMSHYIDIYCKHTVLC